MWVIKIEGVKDDTDVIKSSLESSSLKYPIFILNSKEPLYKFIEELEVDDNLLFRFKIAKEMDFSSIEVMLKDKISEDIILGNITSLSSLLCNIEESKIKNCKLIINTEDNSLVSEIVQALLYLDIELEVIMKKEKADRAILDKFTRQFDKIAAYIISAKKALYNLDINNEFSNVKHTLVSTLYDIENNLEKARERNLNISIMATKKAGKSVIVNSFINDQYAPTSLELPTPNTCIYKRSRDENIRLIYGRANLLFKNAADIYKYIYKEFKKAQNDRENRYTLDDMEIQYINSNSDFSSFTVVDTPGSNYAPAKDMESGENRHRKIAYEWIEKSDVALFLINYSNYLSTDEEEFLRRIKSEFEKHDKFYSLVVVVNKLDEIFISECENKSVVRFLDYIRCKLSDLGYKSFIVMGTSARSYFDVIKVCRIDGDTIASLGENVSIEELKGPILRKRLKALKRCFIGKNEMSALSFVDDQLEKLECFYGLEDYDLNTLRQKSGVPSLISYTKYIAVQKAYAEVYGFLIRNIDEKYVSLKNLSILNSLIDLKKEKNDQVKEIKIMLDNIIDIFKQIQINTERKLSFEELRVNLFNELQASINRGLSCAFKICEAKYDELIMKLVLMNSEQLGRIKNKIIDIDLSISNKALNEELDKIVDNFLKELNDELDKKQKYIIEAERNMKSLVKKFSYAVRKEYDLKDFNIEVPKIDQVFKSLLIKSLPDTYNIDNAIKEKIIDSIEIRGNIVGRLANYIINSRFGYYTLNSRQLQSIKYEYIEVIKDNIKMQYNSLYNLLRTNLTAYLDGFDKQLYECFKNISSTYRSIITDVSENLTNSRKDIESQLDNLELKLKFFNEIHEITKEFMSEWDTVRDFTV